MHAKSQSNAPWDSGLLNDLRKVLLPPSHSKDVDADILSILVERTGAKLAILWCSHGSVDVVAYFGCDDNYVREAERSALIKEGISEVCTIGKQLVLKLHERHSNSTSDSDLILLHPMSWEPKHQYILQLHLSSANARNLSSIGQFLISFDNILSLRKLFTEYSETQEEREVLLQCNEISHRLVNQVDLDRFGKVVVNELPKLLKCDRISLLTVNGSKCRVVAISGISTFDRRSNVIKYTERLCKLVVSSGDDYWSDSQHNMDQSISDAWSRYSSFSHSQSTCVLLLRTTRAPINPTDTQLLNEIISEGTGTSKEIIGAIVLDGMDGQLDCEWTRKSWEKVGDVVSGCLSSIQSHNAFFLVPLQKKILKFTNLFHGRTRKKAYLTTIGLLTVVTIPFMIETDFLIRCEGVLQPVKQTAVYATEEGVVTDVFVNDGDFVEEGQVLIRQQNPSIEEQYISLMAKVTTLSDKLNLMIYKRSRGVIVDGDSPNEDDLVANTVETESELLFARKQLEIVKEKRDRLSVTAPFRGIAHAWDIDKRLQDRPIEVGTKLFTIASVDSPWELQLKVPDNRASYVFQQLESPRPIRVNYVLSSSPGRSLEAVVNHVAPNLDIDQEEGSYLPVSAECIMDQSNSIKQARPGSTVVGKIKCGTASLAYCKTYEFIDWCRRIYFRFVY